MYRGAIYRIFLLYTVARYNVNGMFFYMAWFYCYAKNQQYSLLIFAIYPSAYLCLLLQMLCVPPLNRLRSTQHNLRAYLK